MESILSWEHKRRSGTKKNDVKPVRTDYYWSKIELMEDGMRHTKYLTILSVTAVLTSAHGNVDVV